eukprot:3103661-Alexandrium_andersonii.AAC.1
MFLLGRFPQVRPVLEWAEKRFEPIRTQGRPDVARLAPGFDHCQLSGVLYSAIQRIVRGQLVTTKP